MGEERGRAGGGHKEGSHSVSQRGVRIIEMKTWERTRPASGCEKCEAGRESAGALCWRVGGAE